MMIHFLSLLSVLFLGISFVLLILHIKKDKHSFDLWIPLAFSIILYIFINFSNFLEHSGISAYFDPSEDIAEVVFILLILFFFYNYQFKESYSEIKSKEKWLNSSFKALEEGIITSDKNSVILFVNKKMEQMCGLKKADVIGKRTSEILNFVDKSSGYILKYDPFALALKGDIAEKYPRGIFLRSPDGDTLVTINISLICNHDSEAMGVVAGFHDVGKYYSLMEQLNHTHKMEALGQLAGGVAHDLNNMLAGILGAEEILRYRMEDGNISDNEDLLNIVLNSANNAKELTSNLLSFGRKSKIVSTPVVLQNIIRKTIAIAEKAIEKDVTINITLPPDDLYVIGDPWQLQNAILNLILNARDAQIGKDDKEINIILKAPDYSIPEVENSDNRVEISVCDKGNGVPPSILEHIFDPFFTTKEEGKGTGLGLSAVKSTVHSHNGTIEVHSEIGRGTCFHIFLPSVDDQYRKETSVEYSDLKNEVKERVLIIDDDPLIQSAIRHMLKENSYLSISAESGKAALELFKERSMDIQAVMIDMVLPDMSGLDIQFKINQIKPGIPVIMTSGFSYSEESLPGKALFLHKPFTMHQFMKCLDDSIHKN